MSILEYEEYEASTSSRKFRVEVVDEVVLIWWLSSRYVLTRSPRRPRSRSPLRRSPPTPTRTRRLTPSNFQCDYKVQRNGHLIPHTKYIATKILQHNLKSAIAMRHLIISHLCCWNVIATQSNHLRVSSRSNIPEKCMIRVK